MHALGKSLFASAVAAGVSMSGANAEKSGGHFIRCLVGLVAEKCNTAVRRKARPE